MGIIEFFGLRPVRHEAGGDEEIELDVRLDGADMQRLDTARRTLEAAAVTDDDEKSLALLTRAALELQSVARQNHPRVVALGREIGVERAARHTAVREADTLHEAVAQDADRWREAWNELSDDAVADGDADAREQRQTQLGDFVAELRAGLERHEAALQGLRGRAGEVSLVGVEHALHEARVTLQAASATWQKRDAARSQAAKLDALEDARARCVQACSDELGKTGVLAWTELRGDVVHIIEELETPDELDPAQAMREADRLIGELDKLTERVVRGHYAELKATLAARLEKLLSWAQERGVEPDAEAVERFRRGLAGLAAQDKIDTENPLAEELHQLEEDVRYAQAAKATQRDKLPVRDEARARLGAVKTGLPLEELIERMVPGRMADLRPGPLGEARPKFEGSTWPEVKLQPAKDKFRFAPTKAVEGAAHTCTITPIGAHDIGKIVMVAGTSVSVMVAQELQTFRDIKGAKAGWQERMLRRGVTKQGYKEIELRELEHLVDFSHAFAIAAGRLAEEVTGLSGQEFASEGEAVAALVGRLADAGALVPADPQDLATWQRRAQQVTRELADFSTDRDKRGTHSPAANVAREEGDGIVIEPVFKEVSLATAEIISLARVDAVFGGLGASKGGDDAWVPNTVRRIKARTRTDFFDAVSGNEVLSDYVPAGAEVTIQTQPSSDLIWVGSTAGAVKIADGTYLKDQTPVYFRVSTQNLA